jgi:hypothetical protein
MQTILTEDLVPQHGSINICDTRHNLRDGHEFFNIIPFLSDRYISCYLIFLKHEVTNAFRESWLVFSFIYS